MQIREVIAEQRRRNALFLDAEAEESGSDLARNGDARPGSGRWRGMTPDTPPLSRGSITALQSIREDDEDEDEGREGEGGLDVSKSMIRPGTSTTAPPTVAQEEGVRTQSAPAGLFQEDIGPTNEGRDSKNNLNENNLSTQTEDENNDGGPFLLAPPKRSKPMQSAKEWHQQNKETIRATPVMGGGAPEYVPTEEDELEAKASKDREMTRKRQDLRNRHAFLSLTKEDRNLEMEERYGNALDQVFGPERVRLVESQRKEAEMERKRELVRKEKKRK